MARYGVAFLMEGSPSLSSVRQTGARLFQDALTGRDLDDDGAPSRYVLTGVTVQEPGKGGTTATVEVDVPVFAVFERSIPKGIQDDIADRLPAVRCFYLNPRRGGAPVNYTLAEMKQYISYYLGENGCSKVWWVVPGDTIPTTPAALLAKFEAIPDPQPMPLGGSS